MLSLEQAIARALRELTDDERRGGVAYVDEREVSPGEAVQVDGKSIPVRHRTAVLFVDRVPQANWGHSSRYLLVDLVDERVESIESQFPPFLRRVPQTLRVISKGENVPDWAVVRP